MKVFIAVVKHKYGVGICAGRTREALDKELTKYCMEWWNPDWGDFGGIGAYFEHMIDEGEFLEYNDEIEVAG